MTRPSRWLNGIRSSNSVVNAATNSASNGAAAGSASADADGSGFAIR
jgi:hypothetical protein